VAEGAHERSRFDLVNGDGPLSRSKRPLE